jgi:hypothetical protein
MIRHSNEDNNMKQILTNGDWYKIASTLENNPIGEGTYIPVTYNYYIQKNITKILNLKTELDTCRRQIIMHYGESCEGGVTIKSEFVDEANKEL